MAPAAFRRIGANATAGLIDAAIAIVGEDTDWADADARQDRMNTLGEVATEKLNELDNEFYEYPDGDLTERLYNYVYTNMSKIGVPESFWTGT